MAPTARRTWAPRGETPEQEQEGGAREKVSIAVAVWLSPLRDRLGLYFNTLAKDYFDSRYMAAFLEEMLKDLAGRFVVVWDGDPMHGGNPIRELMGHFADRLDLEWLQPYAPMLNPVEPLWSWLKWGRLSKLGPKDAAELDTHATAELAGIRSDQAFLRNLFHALDLLTTPRITHLNPTTGSSIPNETLGSQNRLFSSRFQEIMSLQWAGVSRAIRNTCPFRSSYT